MPQLISLMRVTITVSTAILPGFTRENVEVNINNDGMSIRAKKEVEKEDRKKNYLHRERAYSSFERSISFPEEVDPAKAEGKMNNGVLELKVPKKEPKPETKPRKIQPEIDKLLIPHFLFCHENP